MAGTRPSKHFLVTLALEAEASSEGRQIPRIRQLCALSRTVNDEASRENLLAFCHRFYEELLEELGSPVEQVCSECLPSATVDAFDDDDEHERTEDKVDAHLTPERYNDSNRARAYISSTF